jgi:hypothetical protein
VLGTLSNQLATGTATYTAPQNLPSTTTYPGLQIIITADAQANTSKTGKATLTIDSGIIVTLNPTTATVPTGEAQTFIASLTNDLKNAGVTWLVTTATPTSTTPYPQLASCTTATSTSASCGSIDANGVYTAPTTLPSSVNSTYVNTLTVVATSVTDTNRFATGTITRPNYF